MQDFRNFAMNFNRISAANFANVMGVSQATLHKWEANGTYKPHQDPESGEKYFQLEDLRHLSPFTEMLSGLWEEEECTRPLRCYTGVELFAGAGGLALGLHKAGIEHQLLCEWDAHACATLRANGWSEEVLEGDVAQIDFTPLRDTIDLLSGGFPCQAFSYAGKQGGFEDTRGTLFFELARAVREIQPRVLLCENVRGLMAHDQGRTLETIRQTIAELGYRLVEPRVLRAIFYQVPQKRERLILVAVRNDLAPLAHFQWPAPYHRVLTLRDAFYKGILYAEDVPPSEGQRYPAKKEKVMAQVPMGGYWRDLPEELQKEYMGGSYALPGGKTGMARRLSLDEPALTLTCAPAQKQTERCHPTETRPLTIREYARIQTFPDDWKFAGPLSAQYKQIGNAVPVNLAYALGRAIVRWLNALEEIAPRKPQAPPSWKKEDLLSPQADSPC